MKGNELRDLATDELKQKSRELADELFKLRIRHASGQLETPSMLGKVRKDIARVATLLRERENR